LQRLQWGLRHGRILGDTFAAFPNFSSGQSTFSEVLRVTAFWHFTHGFLQQPIPKDFPDAPHFVDMPADGRRHFIIQSKPQKLDDDVAVAWIFCLCATLQFGRFFDFN